jgi:hypothetical protein
MRRPEHSTETITTTTEFYRSVRGSPWPRARLGTKMSWPVARLGFMAVIIIITMGMGMPPRRRMRRGRLLRIFIRCSDEDDDNDRSFIFS